MSTNKILEGIINRVLFVTLINASIILNYCLKVTRSNYICEEVSYSVDVKDNVNYTPVKK